MATLMMTGYGDSETSAQYEKQNAQRLVYKTIVARLAKGDRCTDFVLPWEDKMFQAALLRELQILAQGAEMWDKVQSVARGILNATR